MVRFPRGLYCGESQGTYFVAALRVVKGVTTANIKLDLGNGIVITPSITMEAAKELGLKKGDEAYAIIKASEVIVGKE